MQRLVDFVNGKISKDIPQTSYLPGTESSNLKELFPKFILNTLQKGFLEFGKQMKGYFTNEALTVMVNSGEVNGMPAHYDDNLILKTSLIEIPTS